MRKLLSDEKKKVGGERHKLGEVHALFEQIYNDYRHTIDSVETADKDLQQKVMTAFIDLLTNLIFVFNFLFF